MQNQIPTPHKQSTRLLFFWIGIFATLAYRAIIVFQHLDGPWLTIAWYFGTIGFIAYFAHRSSIARRREKVIIKNQLLEKVDGSGWSADDQAALRYVLGTLRSSKEHWNYVTIFVASILALVIGIWLDFIA